METKPWIAPLCIGLACSILGVATIGTPFPLIFFFASGLAFVWAAVVTLRNRPGRYDLNQLRRIQEIEEVRAIELDEPVEYDSFQCLGCGEVYPAAFKVCPRCKCSR